MGRYNVNFVYSPPKLEKTHHLNKKIFLIKTKSDEKYGGWGGGGEKQGTSHEITTNSAVKKNSVSTPLWWIFKNIPCKVTVTYTIDSHSARVPSAWKQRAGSQTLFSICVQQTLKKLSHFPPFICTQYPLHFPAQHNVAKDKAENSDFFLVILIVSASTCASWQWAAY